MTALPLQLSVNVDHVATLRQARRIDYPDPVEAAAVAEAAGACGITIHLRGDRRHIQDSDLTRLRAAIRGKLNLEMAASDEMLAIACEARPHQVTLVPERPEELTTEGGLDVVAHLPRLVAGAERLRAAGIEVSLFVDPDPTRIQALAPFAGLATGIELNTDAYTRARGGFAASRRVEAARSADMGATLGFRIYAGHGLTAANVGGIASIRQIEELNIGHALVSRAVIVGLDAAVREMLAAMTTARTAVRAEG
ncbi:MAG: pyridoxine 5'-phosphate synthase [Thermoanaerobaculia bacterium]|nr:pyridoxine 5'-phosphate synthase [Thermoanaerobaculia bacterium]